MKARLIGALTFWIDAANGAIILIALGLARVVGTGRA